MAKIFISYRRDDSQYVTDSIYEHMFKRFGKDKVFLDVDTIPFGVDFRKYLQEQIQSHDVLLVIIGPNWANSIKERQNQPNDFVRLEVETALKLNKLVVPVLVMGATMPDFSHLPESIRELQWRNAATIRRQPDLANDCVKLAENIQNHFKSSSPINQVPVKIQVSPENLKSLQETLRRMEEEEEE